MDLVVIFVVSLFKLTKFPVFVLLLFEFLGRSGHVEQNDKAEQWECEPSYKNAKDDSAVFGGVKKKGQMKQVKD